MDRCLREDIFLCLVKWRDTMYWSSLTLEIWLFLATSEILVDNIICKTRNSPYIGDSALLLKHICASCTSSRELAGRWELAWRVIALLYDGSIWKFWDELVFPINSSDFFVYFKLRRQILTCLILRVIQVEIMGIKLLLSIKGLSRLETFIHILLILLWLFYKWFFFNFTFDVVRLRLNRLFRFDFKLNRFSFIEVLGLTLAITWYDWDVLSCERTFIKVFINFGAFSRRVLLYLNRADILWRIFP